MKGNTELLAGLLIVNEGKAPGRPPGVEPRSLLAGGPQRANRQLCATCVLKEIAMKTFIIVTILSVGVLLRPEMAPTTGDIQTYNQTMCIGTLHQAQRLAVVLTGTEMMGLQGGAVAECHQEKGTNGDTYASCCIDFWLFRLCFEVNLSAIERLIPF
jgi:hypothetical protein